MLLALVPGAAKPQFHSLYGSLERSTLAGKDAHIAYTCTSPEDVLKTIKDDKIEMIDLRFTDLPGLWQHFSVPPRALDLDSLAESVGFDGSSIRGFQEIQESDMLVIPDPTTVFLDPFAEARTLVLICNIRDPITGQSYSRDSRYIALKAENYLKGTAIGDASYFGPELEHFVFNEVRYDQSTNYGYYEIDAIEANWNAAKRNGPSLGHKLRPKEGYFPVPPADLLQDARTNMVSILEAIGVAVEAHHHEVATGGKVEIDMRFAALTRMADNVMICKNWYSISQTASDSGAHHGTRMIARSAPSTSSPAPSARRYAALGLDRSARPSKRGNHAANAYLTMLARTEDKRSSDSVRQVEYWFPHISRTASRQPGLVISTQVPAQPAKNIAVRPFVAAEGCHHETFQFSLDSVLIHSRLKRCRLQRMYSFLHVLRSYLTITAHSVTEP